MVRDTNSTEYRLINLSFSLFIFLSNISALYVQNCSSYALMRLQHFYLSLCILLFTSFFLSNTTVLYVQNCNSYALIISGLSSHFSATHSLLVTCLSHLRHLGLVNAVSHHLYIWKHLQLV